MASATREWKPGYRANSEIKLWDYVSGSLIGVYNAGGLDVSPPRFATNSGDMEYAAAGDRVIVKRAAGER